MLKTYKKQTKKSHENIVTSL